MAKKIRLWHIQGKELEEIKTTELPNEDQLENWLENDISMVDENLIVVGRQVNTDFGGSIDLLCMDSEGKIVIIELKKGRTPREVTAQMLDYGAWVYELSGERVVELANNYLTDKDIEETFEEKFGYDFPETINENHKMIIVASEIDNSTERIINYLSDAYGVHINLLTFQFFQDSKGDNYLGRVFLLEPEKVETASLKRKKRRRPTYEDLESIAENNGVGELYHYVVKKMDNLFDGKRTTQSSLSFKGRYEDSRYTLLHIYPKKSDSENGVYFRFYIEKLANYLGVDTEEIIDKLSPSVIIQGEPRETYSGGPLALYGYFNKKEQIDQIAETFNNYKNKEIE